MTAASPDVVAPGRVFLALLRRDIHVARRELAAFLVRTTLQPILFVVVFGYLLPRMGFVQKGYTSALLPGILGISLALSSIQSVALPMVTDFGWTREIEDRLLAHRSWRPLPVRRLRRLRPGGGVGGGHSSCLQRDARRSWTPLRGCQGGARARAGAAHVRPHDP